MLKLLLAREAEPKPPVFSGFAAGEVPLHLAYIRDALGDKDYLLGDTLQGPDFGVGFILNLAERLGQLEEYPTLKAYVARIKARPGFQRAIERAVE